MALAYADKTMAPVQAVGLLVMAPNTIPPIQSLWVSVTKRQMEVAYNCHRSSGGGGAPGPGASGQPPPACSATSRFNSISKR